MKGFFSNNSALFQLGIFLYLILIGVLLNSAVGYATVNISGFLSDGKPANMYDFPFYTLHALQFSSNIFIFILPTVCTAYLCSKKPAGFIHVKRGVDIRIILLSIVMLLLISPFIGVATELNSKIQLPEFMSSIAEFSHKSEYRAAKVTEKLLSENGIIPFAANIFTIGIMAGISEEFLFRGALLSIIRKKIKKPHTAIWMVAIIFSIIHFQFSGFIPRILLGAFLGYLLFWSKNIWVPVFVHFLNNTIIVIAQKVGFYQLSPDSTVLTGTGSGINEWHNTGLSTITYIIAIVMIVIITVLMFALFVLCAKKIKKIADVSD